MALAVAQGGDLGTRGLREAPADQSEPRWSPPGVSSTHQALCPLATAFCSPGRGTKSRAHVPPPISLLIGPKGPPWGSAAGISGSLLRPRREEEGSLLSDSQVTAGFRGPGAPHPHIPRRQSCLPPLAVLTRHAQSLRCPCGLPSPCSWCVGARRGGLRTGLKRIQRSSALTSTCIYIF